MKTDAQKWEELANEAIADAGYWKRMAKNYESALKQVGAILNQPVHHSSTRTANAIQILRADAGTARIIISNAIDSANKMS